MNSNRSDGEMEKASGFSIRMIAGAAAVITGIVTIYHFVLSRDSNLIATSGFGIALFSFTWICYSVYLAAKGKHGKWKLQSLAVPIALLAVSPLMFLWSRSLGPDIGEISVADEDDEQLVISGRRFGKDASNLKVVFDGSEQTPLSLSDGVLKVAIPPSFQKGNIAVRRGPRTSASKYFAFPGVTFDAIVVNMFRPSPTDSLLHQFSETCPHFPWYSYQSDHFSFWPPRHSKECRELVAIVHNMFEGDAGRELSNWETRHPSTVTALGRGADQQQARFLSLRSYFRGRGSDAGVLGRVVGPNIARLMEKAEAMFWGLDEHFPNRLLLLKIRNQQNVDAENIQININVKNDIYDAMVDMYEDQAALAEKLEKDLSQVQNVLNLVLPRLRPGNEAEVKVWYYYQEPGLFTNDAVDAQWKHHEGILVNNIGATNLHFKRDKRLYEKFQADSLIPVDPVKSRSRTPSPAARPEPPRNDSPGPAPGRRLTWSGDTLTTTALGLADARSRGYLDYAWAGTGISGTMTLHVINRTEREWTVKIESGTMLESSNAKIQTMVVTEELHLSLHPHERQAVEVQVSCLDIRRPPAGPRTQFGTSKSPCELLLLSHASSGRLASRSMQRMLPASTTLNSCLCSCHSGRLGVLRRNNGPNSYITTNLCQDIRRTTSRQYLMRRWRAASSKSAV